MAEGLPGGEYQPRPPVTSDGKLTDPYHPPMMVRPSDGKIALEKIRSGVDVLADSYWEKIRQGDPTGKEEKDKREAMAATLQSALKDKKISRFVNENGIDEKDNEILAVYTQYAQENGYRIGDWIPSTNPKNPTASATLERLRVPQKQSDPEVIMPVPSPADFQGASGLEAIAQGTVIEGDELKSMVKGRSVQLRTIAMQFGYFSQLTTDENQPETPLYEENLENIRQSIEQIANAAAQLPSGSPDGVDAARLVAYYKRQLGLKKLDFNAFLKGTKNEQNLKQAIEKLSPNQTK